MAEKTINTRILLKYDTYTNWTTNNPILKKGEVAIATIETNAGGVQNAPSIVVKVGDGTTAYNSLKFVSGLAADVYSWAKASTKPSYTASEISGLSDFISGEIEDTDTQYKIVQIDNYNYKLQSKALNGTWTDVEGSSISIPLYDDSALDARVSDVETLVGSTAVSTQITNAIGALDVTDTAVSGKYVSAVSETDGKISVTRASLPDYSNTYDAKGAAAAVQDQLDEYITSNNSALNSLTSSIKDGTTIDSFADVETALAGKQASGDYATKAQAQAYADAKDTAISAAQSAADAAQADVDTLETTVGTLVGDDADKSARTIASEEVAKIVAGADASYDTLKEIADWISSHSTDAASMNSQINSNTTAIEALETQANATDASLTELDNSLAAIAKTGNINDLVQTTGDVLIFDCGNSTL